ncbi:hypothetical protein [Rhizobium sp. FY34]|uniref:hypothetical protein n=1 Tax=Rhizobium sp. FY34 TaxID=2562309 RepID=UPI0010C0469C|nr:hypothetical protein [Rhizobium sp. FY34]
MDDKHDNEEVLPSVDLTMEGFAEIVSFVFAFAATVRREFECFTEKVQPSLMALSMIDWAVVRQRIDELPQKSKDAMRLALDSGWFFGWHDGLQSLMELVDRLSAKPASEHVDQIMADYYRANMETFAAQLYTAYPNRAAPLRAAIYAHSLASYDGYFLSIPVFIAQGDGLLAENAKVKSPINDAGVKEFHKKYASDQKVLDLMLPFLDLHTSRFWQTEKARRREVEATGKPFVALNRHQIIHGEVSDYGSEINSLKAFSFLVFAGLHVPAVLTEE